MTLHVDITSEVGIKQVIGGLLEECRVDDIGYCFSFNIIVRINLGIFDIILGIGFFLF